jgi:hypothetical protein
VSDERRPRTDRIAWLFDLRQLYPILALAAALAVASALLPLPDRSAGPGGVTTVDAAGNPIDGTTGETLPDGGLVDPAVATGPGGVAGAGQATATTARRGTAVGPADIAAQEKAAEAKKGATYQGVTATSVKWGYSAQDKGCGGFNQSETAAAYGGSSNPSADYAVAEEFFNKYPAGEFPLPADIKANVNPQKGYWGRKIVSIFRDSGGFACPDVGRANAVTMAESDKVFGLIQRGNEGPEVPMSLVMAQHKLIAIGRQNTGPLWFKQRAPYFWDGMWGEGVSENIALGSWICRDWAGKSASDTGDPLVTNMPRTFGIVYPDDPGFRELSAVLKAELGRCKATAVEYSYPFDLPTLEAQTETVIAKMKRDRITTVLSIADFISILLMSKGATAQGYHPEWVRSGWGLAAYPNAYRTFMVADQAKNAWAAADAASIAEPAYHDTEAYRAWKKVRPNEEPDGDWPSYFYQYKLLALGLAGAGPNLTPETFGQGLQRLCDPCPRASDKLPLMRLKPGHYTHLDGFTLVRWNPNKADPASPPDSNGNPPQGYFDFLENGKRYGLRITDPPA